MDSAMIPNDVRNYTIAICAVIFGADESLLQIDPGNGYTFERKSLIPSIDHLDEVFGVNAWQLRRDYETARINNTDLYVICVCKHDQIAIDGTHSEGFFRKLSDDALVYLDNKIRALRLFMEAPLRFKWLGISMRSECKKIGETDTTWDFSACIPIGEAMHTRELSKFSIRTEQVKTLNESIKAIAFPFVYTFLNTCHIYYDLSYHVGKEVAVTLLVTCLEVLFLEDKNGKQENLSKRCAVYLYGLQSEQLKCYDNLKKAYDKRCAFVHDGDASAIAHEDILFLRKCVREAIIKYWQNGDDKQTVIGEVSSEVQRLGLWPVKN